jgi:hypothetical protein
MGYAHLGMRRKSDGSPAKPARGDVPDLCGRCHLNVRSVFSPLHFAEPPADGPKKTCINCHSNHKVKEPGEETYGKGYADEADPRTKPFLAARHLFAESAREIDAASELLASLKAKGCPDAPWAEELARAAKSLKEMHPLVHALDEARIARKTAALHEDVAAVMNDLHALEGARSGRTLLVAGVWVVALLLDLLIARQLRRFPKPPVR